MEIDFSESASNWFRQLDSSTRDRVVRILDQLEMKGRGFIGTPYGKQLKGTDELYEVIVAYKGHPLRIIYAYEANGSEWAVLLVAGDKKGDDRFYDRMIPAAEKELALYRSDD